MEYNIGASIHNRFDFEIIDAKTNEIKQRAYAENVILDTLWSKLCALNPTWNTYVQYGTGTGTPATTDTALFNYVGYLSKTKYNVSYNHDTGVYVYTDVSTMTETEPTSTAGVCDLTEIGLAYNSTSGLCTHALICDMEGEPTTIHKTSTDIIKIYSTVYVTLTFQPGIKFMETIYTMGSGSYEVLGTFLGSIAGKGSWGISGESNVYYQRYLYFHPYKNMIQLDTALSPTFSGSSANKTVTFTMPRWGASSYNDYYGINQISLSINRAQELIFEVEDNAEWYTSARIQLESLGLGDGSTVDFQTKFAWAKNATVYVDGVAVEATVDYSYPTTDFVEYIKLVKAPVTGWAYSSGYLNQGIFGYQSSNTYPSLNGYPAGALGMDYAPVLENTLYQTVGISQVSHYKFAAMQMSQDMNTWVDIPITSSSYATVPSEYQHYRYIRARSSTYNRDYWNIGGPAIYFTAVGDLPSVKNVHLASAPAQDSVVQISYDTDTIAKDADHVFDFSVTFTFNAD